MNNHPTRAVRRAQSGTTEAPWVRRTLLGIALAFLLLFLVLPLAAVFVEAFSKGIDAYIASLRDPDAWSAIQLTLITAVIAVPLNLVFGVAAAWAIAKHEFKGKAFLTTLVDLPFSVSPVVAGLMYVLVFGANGWFGPWLLEHNVKIIFAVPGIVLATVFVTFPFIARELIPLMQAQGSDEEQAAIVLGATGWQTFWNVTLPNIKWGLLYGVILCNARAMGNSGRCRWCRATSAARPTPSRCTWRSSTTNTSRRRPSRRHRCWPCWPWSRWPSSHSPNGRASTSARPLPTCPRNGPHPRRPTLKAIEP